MTQVAERTVSRVEHDRPTRMPEGATTRLAAEFEAFEVDLLTRLYGYQDQAVDEAFSTLAELRIPQPGMMFMYFAFEDDPRDGKFVNPLDVTPELNVDKKYRLDMDLVTLHVDDLIEELRLSPKKPLEHRLFTRVPLKRSSRRDWLDWIVTSAIDVFLQENREGRDKKLQAFTKDSTPTVTLNDQEAIVVQNGAISLGHGIWGHRKKNAFSRFWSGLTQAFSSPLVSPLLASAGIPALLPGAFKFVNKVLGDYEQESSLKNLWQTRKLDFKIAPDARGTFGLKEGVWVVVDTPYLRRHPDLENHLVDFEHQSFEILDAAGKPIDAPYLVSRIYLQEKPEDS